MNSHNSKVTHEENLRSNEPFSKITIIIFITIVLGGLVMLPKLFTDPKNVKIVDLNDGYTTRIEAHRIVQFFGSKYPEASYRSTRMENEKLVTRHITMYTRHEVTTSELIKKLWDEKCFLLAEKKLVFFMRWERYSCI